MIDVLAGICFIVMGTGQIYLASQNNELPIAKRKRAQNIGIVFVILGSMMIGWTISRRLIGS
jgi:hypothetical protein